MTGGKNDLANELQNILSDTLMEAVWTTEKPSGETGWRRNPGHLRS